MKKRSWLYRLFNDLYEIQLVFEDGKQETYFLQHIKKIDNNLLKGIDEEGKKVEFKSVKPFDYKVKKHY